MIIPFVVPGIVTVANRQALSPATWVNGYVYPSLSYPMSNLAASDGNYCISDRLYSGITQQIGYLDFGTSKYIQDVQVLGISGSDWYGAQPSVGVSVFVADDTGTIISTVGVGGSNTGVYPVNRNSRYLFLYAANTSGYGGDPTGTYDTAAYFDCLRVTAEI